MSDEVKKHIRERIKDLLAYDAAKHTIENEVCDALIRLLQDFVVTEVSKEVDKHMLRLLENVFKELENIKKELMQEWEELAYGKKEC